MSFRNISANETLKKQTHSYMDIPKYLIYLYQCEKQVN